MHSEYRMPDNDHKMLIRREEPVRAACDRALTHGEASQE